MEPVLITLEKHTEGTSWEGIPSIGPVLFSIDGEDPVAPTSPAVAAWMQFRRGTPKGTLLATFSTNPGDGELPINFAGSEGQWYFEVPSVSRADFPATEGRYHWSFIVKDADGVTWPLYAGELEVGANPTNVAEIEAGDEEPTP
jgi:hypothetical protein